ncbi:hypothetical protein [Pseudomonas fluorescens]|uniref:hypothetical protein n=1 Tax=Pseudomonas fluorescens TaxID=294 RepID=UPI001650E085|nr:hypothetical protein [Pseudomonas fluorescens]
MKIAMWFSLMVIATVVATVAGVTGNNIGFAFGLIAIAGFAFNFMSSFVDALRDMRR